jgi:hypothetical protein
MIDWDLSQTHTMADVDWPKPDLDAVDVQPDGAVHLRLPTGREFSADPGAIRHVFVKREGDTVNQIQLNTTPSSRADAHAQAVRWAKEWELPTKPLDDWYRSYADAKGQVPNALSTAPGKSVGPGGFGADVKILYSFDEEKPATASLELSWIGSGT